MNISLPINRFWNGEPCMDTTLHGEVHIKQTNEGLVVSAALPHQKTPRIPNVPPSTRVHNLWEYDVVEYFIVDDDSYTEIELGAGGHFLVLGFSAPRVRKNEYTDFAPRVEFSKDRERWHSSITLPWSVLPAQPVRHNAFVIAGDSFLAHAPLPGNEPDFHQPDNFPQIRF